MIYQQTFHQVSYHSTVASISANKCFCFVCSLIDSRKSKKNILVGFLNFAVPNGGCELSNLSLKVDKFCSENSELKDLMKMKEAIANQRNAKHKRRKKLAPGFT